MSNVPQTRNRGEAQWRAVIMPNGQKIRKGPVRASYQEAQKDAEYQKTKINGIIWVERVADS